MEGNDIGGKIIEAGLPNISGSFSLRRGNDGNTLSGGSGAFYNTWEGRTGSTYTSDSDRGYSTQIINFSAARSSTIYGKSSTVQPAAVTVRYYIRAK